MGFAADEIPMPPGDPDTLSSGVTQLAGIEQWLSESYLVVNSGNAAFYDAAWPSGKGAAAANTEAHTLIGLLTTGGQHTTAASKALGTYRSALADAIKKITAWHKTWDGAENTYSSSMRTLDRTFPSSSPDYQEFKDSYATKRDGVQNPIRTSYSGEMDNLRTAARTASTSLGSLFSEGQRPGDAIESSISDYLLGRLNLTKTALDTQAGIDLAHDIKRQQAKQPPDYKKIRADAAQLVNYQGNKAFNNAFVKTLGPDGVLQLPYDIAQGADKSHSLHAQQQENGTILGYVADATAGYIGSGTDGTKFGNDLRRDAGKNAAWANGEHPATAGDQDLALLLVAGHNWPSGFLAGAADDIYHHERQLAAHGNANDPWDVTISNSHSFEPSYFSQDPGHGDPMIDALAALGQNGRAAEQFFSTSDAKDKMHYLIKTKVYGIVQPLQGNGFDVNYLGDQGRSLGQALQAATASHDPTARNIAANMVSTIGSDLPSTNYDPVHDNYRGYLQPPNMRAYTGNILGSYAHDLVGSFGQHKGLFDPGALRATMRDTFMDKNAYHTVETAVVADGKARFAHAVDSSSSYDAAYEKLDAQSGLVGTALGEVFGQRGQAIADIAHRADMNTEQKADMYKDLSIDAIGTAGLFVPPVVGVPAATTAGDIAYGIIDQILPADQAQNALDSLNAGTLHAAQSGSHSVFDGHVNDRLNYLYQHGGAASGESSSDANNVLVTDFRNGFGNAAKTNDSNVDPNKRWEDPEYH